MFDIIEWLLKNHFFISFFTNLSFKQTWFNILTGIIFQKYICNITTIIK